MLKESNHPEDLSVDGQSIQRRVWTSGELIELNDASLGVINAGNFVTR